MIVRPGALVEANLIISGGTHPSSQASNDSQRQIAKKNECLIVKESEGYKAPPDKNRLQKQTYRYSRNSWL